MIENQLSGFSPSNGIFFVSTWFLLLILSTVVAGVSVPLMGFSLFLRF